jgi:hypothetical protein
VERSDKVALDKVEAKDTFIPSNNRLSEPIFKQQAMKEFIPDPMQDSTGTTQEPTRTSLEVALVIA